MIIEQINDLDSLIRAKEDFLSTTRTRLSANGTTSEIEKILLAEQIKIVKSDLELLRKQLARTFVVQNLHDVRSQAIEVDNQQKSLFNKGEPILLNKTKAERVKKELESGNIVETIEYLNDIPMKEDDKNAIILMRAQYSIINKKFLEGFISFEQLKVETNRIMLFILTLLPSK